MSFFDSIIMHIFNKLPTFNEYVLLYNTSILKINRLLDAMPVHSRIATSLWVIVSNAGPLIKARQSIMSSYWDCFFLWKIWFPRSILHKFTVHRNLCNLPYCILSYSLRKKIENLKMTSSFVKFIDIRLDANYQIDWNVAPDVDFTFLCLKSKEYVEKSPRYGSLPLSELKIPVFFQYFNAYVWFHLNYTKAGKSQIFCLFSISCLPLILHPYSEFRFGFYGKFYTGYSVLKIFLKNFAVDTN